MASPARTKSNAGGILALATKPRAIWRYFTDSNTALAPKIFVIATLLYVLMPVDLIPDVAPLVGWLDDVGFVTVASAWLLSKVSQHAEEQAKPEELAASST